MSLVSVRMLRGCPRVIGAGEETLSGGSSGRGSRWPCLPEDGRSICELDRAFWIAPKVARSHSLFFRIGSSSNDHLHFELHHFRFMAYSQYTGAPGRTLSSPDLSVSFPTISGALTSSPAPLAQRKDGPKAKPTHTFLCTVCWTENTSPPHAFGLDGRIVCTDCWNWIYSISVCWCCGEVVFRKTDAVNFGWCWWH